MESKKRQRERLKKEKARQSVSSRYKFRLDIHIHNTLLIFISLIILCTPMISIYVDVSSFPSFAQSRHTEDASALVEANTKVRVYFSSYSSYSSSFSFFFLFFLLFLFFLFFFRHMAESMQLHFQERNRKTIWVVKHVLGFMYHLCGWLLWGVVSGLAQCRKPK